MNEPHPGDQQASRGPSRMELAGWGLASLIPMAVLDNTDSTGDNTGYLWVFSRFPIILGLACATGRIVRSRLVFIQTLGTFFLLVFTLITPVSTALTLDFRDARPLTLGLLPVVVSYASHSPFHGFSSWVVFAAGFWFAFVCAAASRFFVRCVFRGNIKALVRTMVVFSIFLGLHIAVAPSCPGWSNLGPLNDESALSEWQTIASLHTLLLMYASFPVALFWDETKRPAAQPASPAGGANQGASPT